MKKIHSSYFNYNSLNKITVERPFGNGASHFNEEGPKESKMLAEKVMTTALSAAQRSTRLGTADERGRFEVWEFFFIA